MNVRIKIPPLGDGVTTATVLEWAHEVGDTVTAGETLLSVELEKIDTDIPAPVDGKLVERMVEAGDEVEVGSVIGLVET